MKEFMLFIKATGNPVLSLPEEQQQAHIQKLGGFIQDLAVNGKLKDAQPLEPNGIVISNKSGSFEDQTIDEKEEIVVGYYHINAEDLN